jgi:hypothetical protein
MKATRVIRDRLATLLASSPTALGNPAAPVAKLGIVIEPFVESPDLVLSDLTLATSGFAASLLDCGGTDFIGMLHTPNEHDPIINIVAFVAGFRLWSSTLTAPTTVYGLALIAAGGGVLLATSRFPKPLRFQSTTDVQWLLPASFVFGPDVIA